MEILRPCILPVHPSAAALNGRERAGCLSRRARDAVRLSAERSGRVLDNLRSRPDGCPVPENGIYWSLSHKTGYVAGVTAQSPVGIDLEPVGPVEPKLLRRVADESERAFCPGDNDLFFFRLWTAKEAVVKAVGGRYPDIFRCRVTEMPDDRQMVVRFGGASWDIAHFCFDGHIAAVVTNGMPVEWFLGTG